MPDRRGAPPAPEPAVDDRSVSVVLVHEYYQQPGGEDRAFETDATLLRAHGHRVTSIVADNRTLDGLSHGTLARATLWNRDAARTVAAAVRDAEPPVVAHFHNTFPLLSPAVYRAAHDAGAAVVQTLHNYRLVCPNALLFDGHAACTACVGKPFAWPGVLRGCYRESRAVTALVAVMVTSHKALGTWARDVDVYIALSEFARARFLAGGVPAAKLVVRPNHLARDPGCGAHDGGFALFVGRLAPEKGLLTLLRAWQRLDGRIPLRIVGTGPLHTLARRPVPGVTWLGDQPHDAVMQLMHDATLLVFPSECYENFPLTIIEAFATGLPVVAADIGAGGELVVAHDAGITFPPADPTALANTVAHLFHDENARRRCGAAGRTSYQEAYTNAHAYRNLMNAYTGARAQRQQARPPRT